MPGGELIDRKLRQRFLPFVLNKLNEDGLAESQHNPDKKPQIFSFRMSDVKKMNLSPLGIIPDSKGEITFDSDIGINLQANTFLKFNESESKGRVTLNYILDNIPAIQIREYTQDTRVDFILSIAKFFIEGLKDGAEAGKKLTSDELKNIVHLMIHDLKTTSSSFYTGVFEAFKGLISKQSTYKDDVADKKIVIDFAYMLYYRLLDTSTTNNYILPFNSSELLKGNGDIGWDSNSFGGGVLGKLGFLGDFISKGINLTVTPIWQGMSGSEGYTLDFTVNLFNDTLEHSIANYIFINTIMPQNLPTHYGIFQQPPSVYDLKIEGFNRLFMCSGKFNCNYKGVLRCPSHAFITELRKFTNETVLPWDFVDKMVKKKQIKIPDIYELHLSFKSLLPNTFNNFIFQYALNDNVTMYNNGNVDEQGWVSNKEIKEGFKKWSEMRIKHGKELEKDIQKVEKLMTPDWALNNVAFGISTFDSMDFEQKKQAIYNHYESLSS